MESFSVEERFKKFENRRIILNNQFGKLRRTGQHKTRGFLSLLIAQSVPIPCPVLANNQGRSVVPKAPPAPPPPLMWTPQALS